MKLKDTILTVTLPDGAAVRLNVIIIPSLTVADLKRLLLHDMIALGHGGGNVDTMRLVHNSMELDNYQLIVDLNFSARESLFCSMIVAAPKVNSVIDMTATNLGNVVFNYQSENASISSGIDSLNMSRAGAIVHEEDKSCRSGRAEPVKVKAGESGGDETEEKNHERSDIISVGGASVHSKSTQVSEEGKHKEHSPHPSSRSRVGSGARGQEAHEHATKLDPYLPSSLFKSHLYEYQDFLAGSTPENGAKKVPLDTEITLKFKASATALRLCTEAIQDPSAMPNWRSCVESLPSNLRAGRTVHSLIVEATERRYAHAKANEDRRRASKREVEGAFAMNSEPPLAETYATLRARAGLEAAREVARKVSGLPAEVEQESHGGDISSGGNTGGHPDPSAIAGDMEAYFDYNRAELTRRGFVRWTQTRVSEQVLLLKASNQLNRHNKYDAREAMIAKEYTKIGGVSIAQSAATGGYAKTDEKHDLDMKLDRLRYWWRGVNEGYVHGDVHSWQRYTQDMPISCSVEVSRLGGVCEDIEQGAPHRNARVDCMLGGRGDAGGCVESASRRSHGDRSGASNHLDNDVDTITVPILSDLSQRLPSKQSLGVGSYPKLQVLPAGVSSVGIKERENYPVEWPTATSISTENSSAPEKLADTQKPVPDSTGREGDEKREFGRATRELLALNRELVDASVTESFFDELSAHVTVTLRPAEELEPATDYFVVLRNGLPVLPAGAGFTSLPQYRSAGVVCEDKIIRFRTETKSHRKTVTRASQHAYREETAGKAEAADTLMVTAAKDLRAVDWLALQTRISNGLSSKDRPRAYLSKARAISLAHKEELREKYDDGSLSRQIGQSLGRLRGTEGVKQEKKAAN